MIDRTTETEPIVIDLCNYEPPKTPEGFMIPTYVDMWWDRHTRDWILQVKDKYDNQIGEYSYEPNKKLALKTKHRLEIENNL